MDGTSNPPDWLKVGAIVKVQHWVGVVEDVAVSRSRVMVLIRSPKGVWRNHPAEWLEYQAGQITPADPDQFSNEIELHADRIRRMLDELMAMKSVV
jgi:hypothetical protein